MVVESVVKRVPVVSGKHVEFGANQNICSERKCDSEAYASARADCTCGVLFAPNSQLNLSDTSREMTESKVMAVYRVEHDSRREDLVTLLATNPTMF